MAHEFMRLLYPSGYRSSAIGPDFFLQLSRNFTIAPDIPVRRPGYEIRRKINANPALLTYTERIPADNIAGTLYVAVWDKDTIFEDEQDGTAMISRKTGLVDPYGGNTNRLPSWVHMFGRTIFCNGTDFGVIIHDGSNVVVRDSLADPGTPTVAVQGAGLSDGNWSVQIRWYDDKTKTYSGPSQRDGSPTPVTTSSQGLRVTQSTPPSRATHWQVQLTMTATPTAGDYEITYEPGDSVGLIPIATTYVDLTQDPASGVPFEWRTDGTTIRQRHSNPPAASLVTEFRGRAFYATHAERWLVWSDSTNPEHFYHDTTDANLGYNTYQGDGVSSGITGPCTGLSSNEHVLLYFMENAIVVGEGSWTANFNSNTEFIGRNARLTPLTKNTTGASCPSMAAKDQELYFIGQDGFKMFTGSGVTDLDTEAMQHVWDNRDPTFDHRNKVAYVPSTKMVLFALTMLTGAVDAPTVVCAWHTEKKRWCPPWDLHVASMTLHRLTTDAGVNRGAQLLIGLSVGAIVELGFGDGDGWTSNDSDQDDLTGTSGTGTTSMTVSGKSWAANIHWGRSVVITNPTTGEEHYRVCSANTPTVVSWLGAVTGCTTGWYMNLAGIPAGVDLALLDPDALELVLQALVLTLDDQISRRVD
jgi:hypothetical protein